MDDRGIRNQRGGSDLIQAKRLFTDLAEADRQHKALEYPSFCDLHL